MSTFKFALTRDDLNAGIKKMPEKVNEIVQYVQSLAVAATQYTIVDGKTSHVNDLYAITPTRWQVGLKDFLTYLAPVTWDNKEERFKFSHDKAWKALKLHGLLPEGQEMKGEVPAQLREKLLVFVTGAMSAVSWATFKPKKDKVTKDVTLADLQAQAAKLLAKASELGKGVPDLFPDKENLTAPARPAPAPSVYADLLVDIDFVLTTADAHTRDAALNAIKAVLENASKNIVDKKAA